MKQYLLAVQYDESTPWPAEADREQRARTTKVTDEMQAAGTWVFAGGLLPSTATTVVRPGNGTTTITDGPFAETKNNSADSGSSAARTWTRHWPGPTNAHWPADPRSRYAPSKTPKGNEHEWTWTASTGPNTDDAWPP
jgi:hypothetical protein